MGTRKGLVKSGCNSHGPGTHPKEGLPRKKVGLVRHKCYACIFWFCSHSLLILLRAPRRRTAEHERKSVRDLKPLVEVTNVFTFNSLCRAVAIW